MQIHAVLAVNGPTPSASADPVLAVCAVPLAATRESFSEGQQQRLHNKWSVNLTEDEAADTMATQQKSAPDNTSEVSVVRTGRFHRQPALLPGRPR